MTLQGTHRASDPEVSAWVSANAGAGKTFTLANRVTRLLLAGAKPERILCLTYTKAAAAEMAGRLFAQLGDWAMADDAALAQRIVAIGAEPRDKGGLQAARRLFALALETPGGLKIQTIHSFCQTLLARFPLEAGVPPAFGILDDETARALREQSIARVLDRAGSGDEPLADATARFVTATGEMPLHAMLAAGLGGERRRLERFLASSEGAIADAICAAHGAGKDETPEGIEAEFCAAAKADEARLREVAAWLSGGTKTDQGKGRALQAALRDFRFAAFAAVFFTQAGEPVKKLVTKGLTEENLALHAFFDAMATRFAAAEDRRRGAHAAALAQAALTLLQAVRSEYQSAKRTRAALDYDDLIVATQALLERRDAAQWVLYKLDGGLDHVLIDEAQDTSPEQWAIVTRLTEEFFAGDGKRRGTRTIFAVGDEKQSIFSFQGAEPQEFENFRRRFAGRIAEGAFVDVQLEESRRSTPEILTFVDAVFAAPEARAGVTSGGSAIQHRAYRAQEHGAVEFWPALRPEEIPDFDRWRPVDVAAPASPVSQLAKQIAQRIKSWTNGRTRLPGHAAAIRPGDIMVLMPRREPFASALIRELKAEKVPVAGADRIRLDHQIAVMDLIALGRFVLLPEDDLNLAALLRSPLLNVSEDELLALSLGRTGSLWQQVRRAEGSRIAMALNAWRARADYSPPYEFYASVLSAPQMRGRIITRLGIDANDAIDEFLALALRYESLNTPSLEGFLHWIEHGEADIKRDMEHGRNAVRVMTVHGAKGLEADIVILPDTTSLPDPPGKRGTMLYTDDGPIFPMPNELASAAVKRAKQAAHEKALEERRRLLYVALTRARDRLVVCGFASQRGGDRRDVREGSWYALAQRAADLLGEPAGDGPDPVRVLGHAALEIVPRAEDARSETLQIPDWANTPAAGERASPRLVRPSDAADGEEPAAFSPVGAKSAQRFRRGNLIHTLLAHLPDIAPDARNAAARAFLAARGVSRSDSDALLAETLAVISESQFSAAFAAGSRAEVAIVADLPELGEGARVSGRLDRLAVTATEVLAVDFKTNRPPPSTPGDVADLYVVQMALYRAALRKIFPDRKIVCALVWTEGPSLMRLSDSLLDAAIGKIGARL